MVGVTSVGIVWFDVGEWRSRAPTIVEVTSVGMVWFDVGELRSKAPTMVSVREVHVEICLMLGNGGAGLQPWWGWGRAWYNGNSCWGTEEQGSNHGCGGGVGGRIWVDVGDWKSKAPTIVGVGDSLVEGEFMLGNGGAGLQPWWG